VSGPDRPDRIEERLRAQFPARASVELKNRVLRKAAQATRTRAPATAFDRWWYSRAVRVAAAVVLLACGAFALVDERRMDARLARAFGEPRQGDEQCLEGVAEEIGLDRGRCYPVGTGEPPVEEASHGSDGRGVSS
jgi:hypothetical protein